MKIKYIFLPALFFLFFLMPPCVRCTVAVELDDVSISLEFHNKKVKDVLWAIAHQGKILLLYDEKQAGKIISGKYKNITVEAAIKRIFSGNNLTLTLDPAKRMVIIKTFGAVNYKVISGLGEHEPVIVGGLSLKDLQTLHRNQVTEIERYLTNPDSIDSLTGKTLGEIRHLHEEQSREIQTVTEEDRIRSLHEQQEKEIQVYLHNPDSVDPMSGMRLSKIRALHQIQFDEIKKNNEEEIDPFTHMTNKEIKELHRKQYEKLNGKKTKGIK